MLDISAGPNLPDLLFSDLDGLLLRRIRRVALKKALRFVSEGVSYWG
jgi:hypothetical protein